MSDCIESKYPFDRQGSAVPLAGEILVGADPDGALENKARSRGMNLRRLYRPGKMAMRTFTMTTTSTTIKETSAQRREQES